ncbi:MAG TPA: trimethylamine methyltransferase family protein [Phycisphaerae bacterium]|nr:trimethylamine methyltransferase family protein [Phycisphaerae bacterium]
MLRHQQLGLRGSLYKPLSYTDARRIVEASFRILEKAGMAVYSDTAFEAFARAGAETDREQRIVRLSRSLVEDAIASNPSAVTLYSRDGKYTASLQKDRVHYGTGGTAIYVLDPRTGQRRPSQLEDVVLNARMVDMLENIHVFTINVFPNEITDRHHIDVNRFFHALDNTTKHVMGGVYSLEGCRQVVQMAEIVAGGPDALRRKPFVSFITLIISPLKIDALYGDMTCYLAQQGLPVVVPTEPICGTTSPITLAGNVLLHLTETLGGIALVQCVKKGAPGICGSVGSITNLKNMDHVGGAIERAMINAAVAQLSQYLGIPLYSTGGTSDAKEVDIQAAYESAMSSLLVAMSGANYIHDIAGLMEADLTVSYEKLVMDNEILGMCQRVLRGIEVTEDTLATELIIEKGPACDFLAEAHTVAHMREEFFTPALANRDKREEYCDGESALARAKSVVEGVLARKPQSKLDSATRNQILARFPEIQTLAPVSSSC